MKLTGYLGDVYEQPEALASFLDSSSHIGALVRQLDLENRPRVIISGMGSSHYATFGAWQKLAEAGYPVWWVEASQLLDVAEGLVVPGSLIWLTSQSGESAEIVALVNGLQVPGVELLGLTNGLNSALGTKADFVIDMHAGSETSVSTKSYVNTLAASRLLVSEVLGSTPDDYRQLRNTVDSLSLFLENFDSHIEQEMNILNEDQLLIFTGRGIAASSALTAGLIVKEAAKEAAEGMTAAALRHGVIELAGSNLSVVIFDHGSEKEQSLNSRLAQDLLDAGAVVRWVSQTKSENYQTIPSPTGLDIDLSIRDALAFQSISFAIAQKKGITAGAFAVATKITDVL